MELSALEKELESRTPDEQDRLWAFLAQLRVQRDPSYYEELNRRADSEKGWLSLADLKSKLISD
jgi:hypothetical protein